MMFHDGFGIQLDGLLNPFWKLPKLMVFATVSMFLHRVFVPSGAVFLPFIGAVDNDSAMITII